MAVGEIAVGAVVHQERTAIPRDRGKACDLLARVADAERIVGIDQIDDRRALIDMGLQRVGCQPVLAGGIVDRNLDRLRALLAGEQARPFPGWIRRHQGGARLAAGAADHRQRIDAAFGHQRLGAGCTEIAHDRAAQRLEAERRRIGVKFAGLDRAQHCLAHRGVAFDVIGVLAKPVEPRRRRELVEITVAD
jgi:hypothetical protein